MAISGNLSYGTATIVVTPEQLRTQAGDVSRKISKLERLFSSMRTNVDKTSGYWIGEGGDAHRKLYHAQQTKIEEIISILKERVTELDTMASNYTEGERTASSISTALPTDVIS